MRLIHALTLVIAFSFTSAIAQEEILPADPGSLEDNISQPEIVQPPEPPPPPPVISPDMAIFRRTPMVNGQIESGEWDEHFHFEHAGLEAWTYVDWDSDNLYVASMTTAPVDLLITLDARNDGWFHGSDNYEFVIRQGRDGGSPTLSVSHYASTKLPTGGGAPLTAAEAHDFTLKSGSGSDFFVYEIAIPAASTQGLELKAGNMIGLKVSVGTGGEDMLWIPTAPMGEAQTAELVTVKTTTPDGLRLDVSLRDARIAPGEELTAKITLKRSGESTSNADTIVVGGEGRTSKILWSQLARIEDLQPGKSFTTTFRSPVPRSTIPGSNALGVEVRSAGESIATSLVSFDIVPPYQAWLDLANVRPKAEEYQRISVIIKNNTRKAAYGKVKLNLPEGWSYRWSSDTKEFHIRQEELEQAVVFRVKPPDKVSGPVPVLAEVNVGDEVISASGVLAVD